MRPRCAHPAQGASRAATWVAGKHRACYPGTSGGRLSCRACTCHPQPLPYALAPRRHHPHSTQLTHLRQEEHAPFTTSGANGLVACVLPVVVGECGSDGEKRVSQSTRAPCRPAFPDASSHRGKGVGEARGLATFRWPGQAQGRTLATQAKASVQSPSSAMTRHWGLGFQAHGARAKPRAAVMRARLRACPLLGLSPIPGPPPFRRQAFFASAAGWRMTIYAPNRRRARKRAARIGDGHSA